ncbi:MAG: gamma-glutamyltransferase family protein [Candidatus Tectimicrobiota bacterium]
MTTTHTATYPPGPQGAYAHRPMVWGKRGMVGGGTQLTAQTGMRILWQGGNAVDAAIATAFAAGVMEPTAHYSLGGEVAMLCYDRRTQRVHSVVGQGWAPQAATVDHYLAQWGEIPSGVLSTTVPGVISALLTTLSHYGTMSFRQVVESALDFARHGFPAYQLLNRAIGSPARLANLRQYPDSARIYLPNGQPPVLGSLFVQQDLARTLSLMVEAEQQALGQGQSREAAIQAARDVFYKGDVARRMVKALQALGGLYTYEDFAEYTSPLEEPISTTYRGYEIFTNRTWTQGITLLQALNILEGYDLAALGHNSPQAIHLQVEALKLAFADRECYIGDPAHVDVPVDGLLSKAYAALRRSLIDPNRAQAVYPPGDPRGMLAVLADYKAPSLAPEVPFVEGDGDGTTYLATVDEQGNMVSVTPSSFAALTQGMILGDTGILVNCRGCYFWLDPDNPNAIAPHKRPRTTPCTFIVLKNGQPYMTLGTPGGDSQPQSNAQVFMNLIDFGLNVQDAVEAPRFCSYSFPRSPWPHRSYANRLTLEARVSQEVVEALQARGHQMTVVGPWAIRNGFAPILVDTETGVYHGGADPRKESVMLGW